MKSLPIVLFGLLLPSLAVGAAELQLSAAQLATAQLGTERVERRELAGELSLTATLAVDPRHRHRVAPLVDGFATELLAVEDQVVTRDQPLARLRSPALDQAQAEYIEAAARFALAASERERLRPLWQDGIVADSRWRGADSEYQAAAAILAARRRLLILSGLDAAAIQRLGGSGSPAAMLELRSPSAGVVTRAEVEPGQWLSAGQTAFQVEDVSRLWAVVAIPAQHLPAIEIGSAARIHVASHPDRSWEARLESLGATVSGKNQTVNGRLVIANPDGALRPGLFATVVLATAAAPTLAVPQSAIIRIGDQHFVFRALGGGRFEPVKVAPGASAAGWTAVAGDLATDAEVVSVGASALKSHWQYLGEQP